MSLVLDLIFPRRCYCCQKEGSYFCPNCSSTIPIKGIKSDPNNIQGCLSVFSHHSFIRKAITDIKYNFASDICNELVNITKEAIDRNFKNLLSFWIKNNFIIVPIPLHPMRQNWRGFNQSDLCAKLLSQKINLPFSNDLISRSRNTPSQVSQPYITKRRSNINQVFTAIDSRRIKDKNIILFDDVTTTGSTLRSAADLLNHHKASSVWALTISG